MTDFYKVLFLGLRSIAPGLHVAVIEHRSSVVKGSVTSCEKPSVNLFPKQQLLRHTVKGICPNSWLC